MTIYHNFNCDNIIIYRKPVNGFYYGEEIKKAAKNLGIIHFTTSFLRKRPWIVSCQHRYVDIWLWYKDISSWKSKPLWNNNIGIAKKVAVEVFSKLLQGIMIRLTGLVLI